MAVVVAVVIVWVARGHRRHRSCGRGVVVEPSPAIVDNGAAGDSVGDGGAVVEFSLPTLST
jgi:hypothetical protein